MVKAIWTALLLCIFSWTGVYGQEQGTKEAPPDMVNIPGGEFTMGSSEGDDDERPVHTASVKGFWMDMYEVTNAQYKVFVDMTNHRIPYNVWDGREVWKDNSFPEEAANQPVINVSWDDAVAYCRWLGKRLPTETEWERAARGGLDGKRYPWGDGPPEGRAWLGGRWAMAKTLKPVGSYSPNGYGLYDMAGNTSEWVSSAPLPYPYAADDGREEPEGYEKRVLRGGSWRDAPIFLRCANRAAYIATARMNVMGFRCARDE